MGAPSYLTTADVLNFTLGVDPAGPVMTSNVLDDSPLLRVMAARARKGFQFRWTQKTSDPSVGFRAANTGTSNSKATYRQQTCIAQILDASNSVDVAVAEADEWGLDHALAQNSLDSLTAALFAGEKQLFYGSDNDAAGFAGFAQTCDDTTQGMVIDAGGSIALGASSVFLIRTGNENASVIWGANGQVRIGERVIIKEDDGEDGFYPAYYTPICAWMGLQLATAYDVARICNITAQTSHTLDDDMISSAIQLFPAARKPNLIAMSRRSLGQLQQSRTSFNPLGKPAEFPESCFNIPIVVTDAIVNTEAILGVTG